MESPNSQTNKWIRLQDGITKQAKYIAGEKRRRPSGTGAKPISREILAKCIYLILNDDDLSIKDKYIWILCFTMAFTGIKRAGEYTDGLKWNQIQMEIAPLYSNYEDSSYFILNRTHGKTYQYGGDLFAVFICTCDEKDGVVYAVNESYLCCLHNLIRLVDRLKSADRSKPNMNDPLFEFTDTKVLNYPTLLKKLKQFGYLPHGFRKGGAQYQVSKGVPIITVMKQADWRNVNTIRKYCDTVDRNTQIEAYRNAKKATITNNAPMEDKPEPSKSGKMRTVPIAKRQKTRI
eukprot:796942_1